MYDHYQAPKHVVVPYVENTSYSTNKYSCVRRVHTLYISYFIEHNGDDEPHDNRSFFQLQVVCMYTGLRGLYLYNYWIPHVGRSYNLKL